MTDSHTTIKCPECGHEFDISDVLYHQVEHELKKDFEAQLKKEREKFRSESEELNQSKKKSSTKPSGKSCNWRKRPWLRKFPPKSAMNNQSS